VKLSGGEISPVLKYPVLKFPVLKNPVVNTAASFKAEFSNVNFFAQADLSRQIFAHNFDKPILKYKHKNCKFIDLKRHKRAFL
jgi:hypothetical protein